MFEYVSTYSVKSALRCDCGLWPSVLGKSCYLYCMEKNRLTVPWSLPVFYTSQARPAMWLWGCYWHDGRPSI